jgi:hypothetical protein
MNTTFFDDLEVNQWSVEGPCAWGNPTQIQTVCFIYFSPVWLANYRSIPYHQQPDRPSLPDAWISENRLSLRLRSSRMKQISRENTKKVALRHNRLTASRASKPSITGGFKLLRSIRNQHKLIRINQIKGYKWRGLIWRLATTVALDAVLGNLIPRLRQRDELQVATDPSQRTKLPKQTLQ